MRTYPSHAPARRTLTAVALMAAVAACSGDVPTAPVETGPVALSAVPGGPGAVAAVRGGAHFDLRNPPDFVGDFKWIYKFSINATARADGSASGRAVMMSRIPPGSNEPGAELDWWFTIDFDCVEVEGNTAWLTGPIDRARTDSPVGPPVGAIAMLIVQDNGPGARDQISVGPAFIFGATDCRDKPAVSAGASTNGNVTVTGGT